MRCVRTPTRSSTPASHAGRSSPTRTATGAGANMPAIEKYIVDYTPFGPDADDLEENPMLKRRREEQAEKAEKEAEALQAA